jgi:putative ABC transport system permease protein
MVNYLKVAWRNIGRHKGYSFINIFGLAMGLACCLAILLVVRHGLSVDRYQRDHERIFRVLLEVGDGVGSTRYAIHVPPLAPALRQELPEIEQAARLFVFDDRRVVKRGEKVFYEEGFAYADPQIFSILDLPLAAGDASLALQSPGCVVIPQRLAAKYFPGESALDRSLHVNGRDYRITAVMRDLPGNTHLLHDIFLPMADLGNPPWMEDWTWPGMTTYVKLTPGADVRQIEEKINRLGDLRYRRDPKARGKTFRNRLQPLADIYLHSGDLEYSLARSGNPLYLALFAAIGLVILAIACINFANLATARSARRAGEVGVRKAVGAKRADLVGQFLIEAGVTVGLALLTALGLVVAGRPLLNRVSGVDLPPGFPGGAGLLAGLLGLAAGVTLLAGGYPAFFLSRFKPAGMLRGGAPRPAAAGLRKTLVIVQFAVSVALSIGAIVFSQQLAFMRGKDLGFVKEQKIVIPLQGRQAQPPDWEALKAAFRRHHGVTAAAASFNVPGGGAGSLQTRLHGEGRDDYRMMSYYFCDADFLPLYGVKLAAGRSFSAAMGGDASSVCLINESAAAAFGWSDPQTAIGRRIETGLEGRVKTIVGVVRDFHYRGVQFRIEPLVIESDPRMFSTLTLQVKMKDQADALASIAVTWQQFFPGVPLEYSFLDADLARLYGDEERAGRLVAGFTALGFAIACLGLFGLTSHLVQQRSKEVGVRKALGASEFEITALLLGDFAKWVTAGAVLACPVAWLFVDRWLNDFPYRRALAVWPFLLSVLMAQLLALLTVSYQTVRAARANPVESLRCE